MWRPSNQRVSAEASHRLQLIGSGISVSIGDQAIVPSRAARPGAAARRPCLPFASLAMPIVIIWLSWQWALTPRPWSWPSSLCKMVVSFWAKTRSKPIAHCWSAVGHRAPASSRTQASIPSMATVLDWAPWDASAVAPPASVSAIVRNRRRFLSQFWWLKIRKENPSLLY